MTEVKDFLEIQTGTKELEIKRDGKVTGDTIYLNPTDSGWMQRFDQFRNDLFTSKAEINKRYDELQKIDGNDEQGMPLSLGPILEYENEVILDLRRKLDKVFGEGVSQKVFGNTMNMEVIVQFLTGILPYIEEARKSMIEKYEPPKPAPPVIKKHRKKRASKK
jgi:hypothetical protein